MSEYKNVFFDLTNSLDVIFSKRPKHQWHIFQKPFRKCEQWCFTSDYCLDDKSKFNDCFAYTIFPMGDLEYISKSIKKYIPKDIKDTKKIEEQTIKYLKEFNYFFHIIFVMKNKNLMNYTKTDNISSKQALQTSIEHTYIETLQSYPLFANKIKNLMSECKKNNFNKKIYNNIIWNAFFSSYINIFLFQSLKKCKKTLWLPDRDSMNEYCNNILEDFYCINYNSLYRYKRLKMPNNFLCAIGTQDKKSSKLWFDDIVRIPDYFAGTVASWDFNSISCEKEKHAQIIKDVILDNPRFLMIQVELSEKQIKFSLVDIKKAKQ